MVDTRALRARECIIREGSSPSLGTTGCKQSLATRMTGCSAVGSAPRLGRGGPRFEPGHPDKYLTAPFLSSNLDIDRG